MRKEHICPYILGFLFTLLVADAVQAEDESGVPVLVSTSYGNAYYILIDEDGVQGSQPQVYRPTLIGLGSYGSALGDFDNDGIEDYLIGGRPLSSFNVCMEFHKGAEGGGFWYGAPFYPQDGWNRCSLVLDFAEADFDNDGNLDVVVNNPCTRRMQLLLGTGQGSFVEESGWGLPFYGAGLDAGDINSDGCQDVITANWDSALRDPKLPIEVFLGDCTGEFTHYTLLLDSPFSSTTSPVMSLAITLADFNADGLVDVVVSCKRPSNSTDEILQFYAGSGDGAFDQTPIVSGPASNLPSAPPSQVLLGALDSGDFNRDGLMDVAAVHFYKPEIVVYFGLGDGTFTLAARSLVIRGISACLTGLSAGPAVIESNEPPVADAGGPYWTVTDDVFLDIDPDTFNMRSEGKWVTASIETDPMGDAEVILDGTGSFDPEGDELTYSWMITDSEGESVTAEGVTPTVQLRQGSYLVGLLVNDGKLDSELSTTTLNVQLLDVRDLRQSDLYLNGVQGSGIELEGSVLVVKFDRPGIKGTLAIGNNVAVYVTGTATGYSTIRVIDPGRPRAPR